MGSLLNKCLLSHTEYILVGTHRREGMYREGEKKNVHKTEWEDQASQQSTGTGKHEWNGAQQVQEVRKGGRMLQKGVQNYLGKETHRRIERTKNTCHT